MGDVGSGSTGIDFGCGGIAAAFPSCGGWDIADQTGSPRESRGISPGVVLTPPA
ncbi:hypothetical protein [Sphingosinicella microcystinivorans]|uniref:hypothetical protein n=1 Tax=Sphingosinicella microcystinivorans TaxID=335406 RepID=UPI001357185E|nr:hypothetical protein [Sphingosinicella microcystinivorans]